LLAQALDSWSGTVVFFFQPAEETAVGAAAMVADGLWERAPEPAVIYGQHVWSGRAGEIEISTGPAMAMADSWKVTVHGRGGHGSRPEETIDPVVLAAHMVVRIQSIVAREVHPQKSAVVTVATFHAGLKENIIPAKAEFTVNVRTLDVDVRERVLTALRRLLAAEADASGAPQPEVEKLYTFPLLVNDPVETEKVIAALGTAFGPEKILPMPARMGSEDFGALAGALGVPAVYWFFGGMPDHVVDGDDPVPSNHSPLFAPALEPTLSTGATAAFTAMWSRLAET
jgi:hippurate hydrolase